MGGKGDRAGDRQMLVGGGQMIPFDELCLSTSLLREFCTVEFVKLYVYIIHTNSHRFGLY